MPHQRLLSVCVGDTKVVVGFGSRSFGSMNKTQRVIRIASLGPQDANPTRTLKALEESYVISESGASEAQAMVAIEALAVYKLRVSCSQAGRVWLNIAATL